MNQLFNELPVYNSDNIRHYHTSKIVKEYGPFVYDPDINDGMVWGIYNKLNNSVTTLLMNVFFFLRQPYVYKFFIFLMMVISPFLLYFSCRNFGLWSRASVIGLVLAQLLFLLDYKEWGTLFAIISSGSFSYIFCIFLSILALSLFYKIIPKKSWRNYLFPLILGAITIRFHVFSFIIFLFPLVLLIAFNLRKAANKKAVLSSFFILIGFFAASYSFFFAFKDQVTLPTDQLLPSLQLISPASPTLGTFFFYLGVLAVLLDFKKEVPKQIFFITVPFIFLFTVGVGSDFLASLDSARYFNFVYTLLIIPSAKFLSRIKVNLRAFALILVLALVFKAAAIDHTSEITFTTQLNPYDLELIRWAENFSFEEGRILVEEQPYAHPVENTYHTREIPFLFKISSGKPVIGGPHKIAITCVNSVDTSLRDGALLVKEGNKFDRHALNKETDPEFLLHFLNVRNIGYVVTSSGSNKLFFDALAEARKIKEISNYSVYFLETNTSYFIGTEGKLETDYNIINITEAPEGTFYIKFNYFDKLRAKQGISLFPFEYYNKTFIGINNSENHPTVEIYFENFLTLREIGSSVTDLVE